MKHNAVLILEFVGSRPKRAADAIAVTIINGEGMNPPRKTGEVATNQLHMRSVCCSVGTLRFRVDDGRAGVGHRPRRFSGVAVSGKLEGDGLAFAAKISTRGLATALGAGTGIGCVPAQAIGAAIFDAIAEQTVVALGVRRTGFSGGNGDAGKGRTSSEINRCDLELEWKATAIVIGNLIRSRSSTDVGFTDLGKKQRPRSGV